MAQASFPSFFSRSSAIALILTGVGVLAAIGVGLVALPNSTGAALRTPLEDPKKEGKKSSDADRPDAPDLDGGIAWLNTSGPLK
ncbi:MAG: hypothetical protein ACRCZF_25885, partial [Gemmataceae bacterium]